MPIFKCPLEHKKTEQLFNVVILFGILAFTAALAAFAVTGFNSRYWADDYCFSALLKTKGVIGGMTEFYNTISNRFGAFLLTALSEAFGTNAIRYLPALVIFLLFAVLACNAHLLFGMVGLGTSKSVSVLIGLMVTFFTLYEAPNLFQSVFWRSGMMSYFTPLLLFLIVTGVLLWQIKDVGKNKKVWWWAVLILMLTFFAGGTSETYAAFQSAFLFLVFVYLLIFKRKKVELRISIFLLVGLIGSLSAMAVMVAAPGNQLRLNAFQQAGNIGIVLQLSSKHALDFIIYSLRGLPIPMSISIFMVWVLTYHLSAHAEKTIPPKIYLPWLVIIPLFIYVLIAAVCAPTAYGMMAYPEARALMIGRFIMVIGAVVWGGTLGIISHLFMDRIVDTCLMSIIFLGILWLYPLRISLQLWQELPDYQARATLWDARQADILKAKDGGEKNIRVQALDSIQGVYELTNDAQFWVNRCAAQFYGIETIVAMEQ